MAEHHGADDGATAAAGAGGPGRHSFLMSTFDTMNAGLLDNRELAVGGGGGDADAIVSFGEVESERLFANADLDYTMDEFQNLVACEQQFAAALRPEAEGGAWLPAGVAEVDAETFRARLRRACAAVKPVPGADAALGGESGGAGGIRDSTEATGLRESVAGMLHSPGPSSSPDAKRASYLCYDEAC